VEQLERVEPVLMVRDVGRSLAFYAQLGFHVVFRGDDHRPTFAIVARDAAFLAMQWHDYEGVTGDRPVLRFPTRDVDALSEELAGLADRTPVADTSWGTREFHVRDPDGNGLQFYADR
jgi:catechol 2,3-dioxygenase-like lactoylglutathione lyase family enzyme